MTPLRQLDIKHPILGGCREVLYLKPFEEVYNEDFGTKYGSQLRCLMDLDRRWESLNEELKNKYQKGWERFQKFKERNRIIVI